MKTVTGLVIVGLVAMLATPAEAHYFIVGGKLKYCSICIDADLIYHNEGAHHELIEFKATILKGNAEILCKNGEVVTSTADAVLTLRKPINPDDIDLTIEEKSGIGSAEVEALLSDAVFLNPDKLDGFGNCTDASPVDVLVRATKVEINTYACQNDKLKKCLPVDNTFGLDCMLPENFTLKDYPKNRPPEGTSYECK